MSARGRLQALSPVPSPLRERILHWCGVSGPKPVCFRTEASHREVLAGSEGFALRAREPRAVTQGPSGLWGTGEVTGGWPSWPWRLSAWTSEAGVWPVHVQGPGEGCDKDSCSWREESCFPRGRASRWVAQGRRDRAIPSQSSAPVPLAEPRVGWRQRRAGFLVAAAPGLAAPLPLSTASPVPVSRVAGEQALRLVTRASVSVEMSEPFLAPLPRQRGGSQYEFQCWTSSSRDEPRVIGGRR